MDHETTSKRARGARVGYMANAPAPPSTDCFREVLEWLLPPPIERAELVQLFKGRASYTAIKSWRFGQCKPPEWAVALLDQQLAWRMAQLNQWRQSLPASIGPGLGWDRKRRAG